jgi:1-acyl-sn-glycerol-3-phosphate acyltransferase
MADNQMGANVDSTAGKDVQRFEWNYAPPPTPYDQVRDNILSKFGRITLHSILHPFIHSYNKLTVINQQSVLNNWPCIITPNHSSHMDTMAVFSSMPLKLVNRVFAVAAMDYFYRNGFIAFGSRLIANVIPLDRTGVEKDGLRLSLFKLKQNCSVLIFPEGTRSTTGDMGQFKKGSIILSREARIPIIPAYISGTLKSMPKSVKFPRPEKIGIIYGEPLRFWETPHEHYDAQDAATYLELRVKELKQKLEEGLIR